MRVGAGDMLLVGDVGIDTSGISIGVNAVTGRVGSGNGTGEGDGWICTGNKDKLGGNDDLYCKLGGLS